MPYTINFQQSVVYKKFFGHVTGEEYCNSTHEVQSNPHFDRIRFIINDYSAVESHSVVFADVELVAAHCIAALKANPDVTVVIVTQDAGIIDLVKQFNTKPLVSWPVVIFPTPPEARQYVAAAILAT